MPRSRVTIRDVAAHAGVSHQTVSRVINNNKRVLPTTRAHVEQSIAELDYRPNAIAQSMARGRTGTLACISPNLTDYTFASIIDGAATIMRQHDCFLLSASAPDEEIFAALIDQLIVSRRVDGIIVINPFSDARHVHIPAGFPTVFAAARPRELPVDSVATDDEMVGETAVNHLLEHGHRAIALLTGPLVEDCSQDRIIGYKKALQKANIMPEERLIIEGDWSPASGYDALQTFMNLEEKPTAIIAQNDQMAIGLLRAARDFGIIVPHQLSIIGVDDVPLASYFSPALTTIQQDFAMIGREAARLLMRAINKPRNEYQHLRVPANLIIRNSTSSISF